MKLFRNVCAAAALCIVLVGASYGALPSPGLEKACGESLYAGSVSNAERLRAQMIRIRTVLQKPRAADLAKGLRLLAAQTRWGTPERAISYLACAWYGIDYTRCRNYLLNIAFWDLKKHRTGNGPDPFWWSEDTFLLLYSLYEHNHDYMLLHDLLTGDSDGAGAEALDGLRSRSIEKHPRGILHVAAISRTGTFLAAGVLVRPRHPIPDYMHIYGNDARSAGASEAALENSGRGDARRQAFRIYVNRVASDPRDPLRNTAKRVLALSRRLDKVL